MKKQTTEHTVMDRTKANEIGHKIAQALGIEQTTRITLDFQVGEPAKVTVEAWATDSYELRDALVEVTTLCDKHRRFESLAPPV